VANNKLFSIGLNFFYLKMDNKQAYQFTLAIIVPTEDKCTNLPFIFVIG